MGRASQGPRGDHGERTGTHIEARKVSKAYDSRDGAINALAEVSFEAGRGSFVSIIGPSGCGKSTLLKIVLNVVPLSAGAILIDGSPHTQGEARMGMVFQVPALPPWRTVLRNVLLPIEALGRDRKAYLDRARELLALTGLEDFAERYPAELSGGMQQRVAICRALIHEPEILLMDEPFGALDAMTREIMQRELLRIWGQTRKTILFVTHSIDEAILLSSKVLVMSPRPGQIVEEVEVPFGADRLSRDLRTEPQFQDLAHHLRERLGLEA